MKKIKYQGGITKLLMSQIGRKNKKRFANLSDGELQAIVQKFDKRKVAVEVVSMSSKNDFAEQVLSILSFQRFVGTPISWTVCSDGTQTDKQIASLKTVFPFVKVTQIDFTNPDEVRESLKEEVLPHFDWLLHFAQTSPYGKKLVYYVNYRIQNPTLFIDSDILFHELAGEALKKIESENVDGWYLPDQVWRCLDSRYKSKHKPQMYQVNSGFFLFNHELDVTPGLDFLNSLQRTYENFTEQTVYHIIIRENNFYPFDPRIFILNSKDQFDFSYGFDKNKIAIRHYTGPVRHKMWQRDWNWQLSLDTL